MRVVIWIFISYLITVGYTAFVGPDVGNVTTEFILIFSTIAALDTIRYLKKW